MENREQLGQQLAQFGTKVRDVKDAMYVLHSKGITTFQWALHRVSAVDCGDKLTWLMGAKTRCILAVYETRKNLGFS